MKRLLGTLLALLLLHSPALAQSGPVDDSNCLTIYTSHKAEVYEPIVREFESRTGLWVRLETGGSQELLERIARESGAPVCDLMFGGGVESLDAYDACFMESELDDPRPWQTASKCLPFSSLPMVIIYNPKLCDPPAGWRDLLDRRFGGRIAFANPAVSGSSYTALATLLQALPEEDALERFAGNLEGLVLEGSGDVVGAVASGRCLIGVTLEETALKGMAAGNDIAMIYPAEGTSAIPDGAALVAGCPHRENAERFLAFILSADVQSRLSTKFYRRSVLDEATDFIQLDYNIAWASAHKADILARWARSVGEGEP